MMDLSTDNSPLALERRRKPGTAMEIGVPDRGTAPMMFFMGSVFLLMGCVGGGAILWKAHAGEYTEEAPPELWAGFCALFALAGVGMLAMGMNALRKRAAHRRALQGRPGCRATADFPWPEGGSVLPRWKDCVGSGLTLAFATAFIGLIAAVMSTNQPPTLVWIILGAFGVAMLFGWFEFARRIIRAVRFAPGRLEWTPFPATPGGTLELVWTPGEGVRGWIGGRASLRCCEQVVEETGSGRNRSRAILHYILWEKVRAIEPELLGGVGRQLRFDFQLPAIAPGSRLSGGASGYFWEFDIELETSGVNPRETHLVPVYN